MSSSSTWSSHTSMLRFDQRRGVPRTMADHWRHVRARFQSGKISWHTKSALGCRDVGEGLKGASATTNENISTSISVESRRTGWSTQLCSLIDLRKRNVTASNDSMRDDIALRAALSSAKAELASLRDPSTSEAIDARMQFSSPGLSL